MERMADGLWKSGVSSPPVDGQEDEYFRGVAIFDRPMLSPEREVTRTGEGGSDK